MRDMVTAIFGLIGVLIGGLITLVSQYVFQERNEYKGAFVAARLIAVELEAIQAGIRKAGPTMYQSKLPSGEITRLTWPLFFLSNIG